MNKSVQFVEDLPTVENTEPVSLYRSTSPFYYRDHDKYILSYGSDSWTIKIDGKLKELHLKVLFDRLSFPSGDMEAHQKAGIALQKGYDEQIQHNTISFKIWIFILKDCLLIHPDTPIIRDLNLRLAYGIISRCEIRQGKEIYIVANGDDNLESFVFHLYPGDQKAMKHPLFHTFALIDRKSALQEAYNGLIDGIRRCRQFRDDTNDYITSDNDIDEQAHIENEILLNESGQGDDELNDVLLDVAPRTESSAMSVELNGGSVLGSKRNVGYDIAAGKEKHRRFV